MLPKSAAAETLNHLTQPMPAQVVALPRVEMIKPVAHAPRLSPIVLLLVIMVHFGVLAALASLRVTTTMPMSATALIVEVIGASPDAQKPTITPPKPKPVSRQERPKPVVETSMLATESPVPTPSAEVAKTVKSIALPPIQAPAQPAEHIQALQTEPRFDADYLDNPPPGYPALSKRAGEEGKVVLRVFVESSGLATRVEVRTSSGFERLDQAAAAAVGRWKFIPARLGSNVVGAWVLVPIVFSLKV